MNHRSSTFAKVVKCLVEDLNKIIKALRLKQLIFVSRPRIKTHNFLNSSAVAASASYPIAGKGRGMNVPPKAALITGANSNKRS